MSHVRFTNRIGNALKQYYPQVLEWFDHYDTVVFCEFLTCWPTLKQVQRARASTLERFFWQHHVHRPALIESRIHAIKEAKALTNDEVVIDVYALQVLGLVEQIQATLGALKRLDDVIADLAPVTERSGTKSWVHWRWQCPMFVRQTFVEWAEKTVTRSYWAGLFYRRQRDKGKGHQAAVRTLAFKWIRILCTDAGRHALVMMRRPISVRLNAPARPCLNHRLWSQILLDQRLRAKYGLYE